MHDAKSGIYLGADEPDIPFNLAFFHSRKKYQFSHSVDCNIKILFS